MASIQEQSGINIPLYYQSDDKDTGELYKSATDYVASFAQLVIKDRNLQLKTPLATIIEKAQSLTVVGLSRNENLVTYYPLTETLFIPNLITILKKEVEKREKTEVTILDLLKAYEVTVIMVRAKTTTQFSQVMYMPDVVARFLDHFDAPFNEAYIAKTELRDPTRAQEHRERTKRWMEGV